MQGFVKNFGKEGEAMKFVSWLEYDYGIMKA